MLLIFIVKQKSIQTIVDLFFVYLIQLIETSKTLNKIDRNNQSIK